MGLPGDSLEIRDGYVYIDGKQNDLPDRSKIQFSYAFRTKGKINPNIFRNQYDITDGIGYDENLKAYILPAVSDEALAKMKKNPNIAEVFRYKSEKDMFDAGIFPQDDRYKWNADNFGPIYIPKKGATVDINLESLPFYRRIIEVYEGSELGIDNKITTSGNQVLLNGNPMSNYTFKQDYYWMMGDNRNSSQDARMWGYVPFNHVVGKPVFIWMSWDGTKQGIMNKIRWERLFTTVGGKGKPVSYLSYFLVLLGIWFAFDFFRKRRKKSGK